MDQPAFKHHVLMLRTTGSEESCGYEQHRLICGNAYHLLCPRVKGYEDSWMDDWTFNAKKTSFSATSFLRHDF